MKLINPIYYSWKN